MNKNDTLTLWISIGAAIFAVILLYSYTQEKSAHVVKKFGEKISVVTAIRDIGEMETITDAMVELSEYPRHFAQPGAMGSMEEVLGKVALAPISEKEQVLDTKVTDPGPITGLSLQVSPSKRALTIPIDEMRGVAKLLKPGDRVDILAALDVRQGNNQRREIRTIMQDVVILATGIKIVNELPRVTEEISGQDHIRNIRAATNFTSITIEADPRDIQDLVYVLSTSPGSLFLSLRHPTDHFINTHLPTSNVNKLLGKSSISLKKPQATKPWAPRIRTRKQ